MHEQNSRFWELTFVRVLWNNNSNTLEQYCSIVFGNKLKIIWLQLIKIWLFGKFLVTLNDLKYLNGVHHWTWQPSRWCPKDRESLPKEQTHRRRSVPGSSLSPAKATKLHLLHTSTSPCASGHTAAAAAGPPRSPIWKVLTDEEAKKKHQQQHNRQKPVLVLFRASFSSHATPFNDVSNLESGRSRVKCAEVGGECASDRALRNLFWLYSARAVRVPLKMLFLCVALLFWP